MESVMSGLCVALSVSGKDKGFDLDIPLESVTGSLINYVTQGMSEEFQPVNANFGILPALAEKIKDKEQRKIAYADRAINAMTEYVKWRNDNGI